MHLAGDGAALADLLAPGRTIASALGFGADQHPAAVFVMANPSAETLDRHPADVAAGGIRVPVTATTPRPGTQALADRRPRQAGHPDPMTALNPVRVLTND